MALTNTNKIINLDDKEYAFVSKRYFPIGKIVPLFIPKIMGNLNGKGTDRVMSSGMFDNAPACKPSFSSSVNRTDEIWVPIKHECEWEYIIDITGHVPKGTQFIVEYLNGDITTPHTFIYKP